MPRNEASKVCQIKKRKYILNNINLKYHSLELKFTKLYTFYKINSENKPNQLTS